MDTKICKHLR